MYSRFLVVLVVVDAGLSGQIGVGFQKVPSMACQTFLWEPYGTFPDLDILTIGMCLSRHVEGGRGCLVVNR